MTDYVTWTTHDYHLSIGQRRGVLSRDQIDEWHNDTFNRTPGWQIYGGNYNWLSQKLLGIKTNEIICRFGCDTNF